MAAVVRGRPEVLADVVRREERAAARPAVNVRRLDRPPQVCFGRHVADRIVHEDGVELPAEPEVRMSP